MDELLTMFLTGQREFGARVHAVTEEQWAAATPDPEWSVADLVAHLVAEHRWAAPLLHGLDLASAGKVVEGTRDLPVDGGTGSNLAEAWDEAAAGAADAFTADGALDRSVDLSRGPTPVPDYLGEMVFDLTVHAWDLGTAINYPQPLPEELVAGVYALAADRGDLSSSSAFGEPVPVPDDAPVLDKLIALTGRDPS
jgi:uncharacterized protein (TIGR03086 family)